LTITPSWWNWKQQNILNWKVLVWSRDIKTELIWSVKTNPGLIFTKRICDNLRLEVFFSQPSDEFESFNLILSIFVVKILPPGALLNVYLFCTSSKCWYQCQLFSLSNIHPRCLRHHHHQQQQKQLLLQQLRMEFKWNIWE
jgi:hypothetical protein